MQISLQANLLSIRDLRLGRFDWHYASLVSVSLYGDKVTRNIETFIMELLYKKEKHDGTT